MNAIPRILTFVAGVVAVLAGLSGTAYAQAIDTFNPGANGYVMAIAVQPDGKVLLGGEFTRFGCLGNCGPGAVVRNYLARLNADGTLDTTFDPGANGPIRAMVLQPDGKIVVAGNFSTIGGGGEGTVARRWMARLNADGSVDVPFNPGVNMNNYVDAMALQPDGKIVVGGGFYAGLGGAVRYYFGRLNADGTADATFAPGANGPVYSIALQPDGKIVLGGLFTALGGEFGDTPRQYIGRLNSDGSVDAAFNPGADNRVDTLAIQADGKILAGGIFSGLGGGTGTTPRFNIGRINANGTVDQDFIPGADSRVMALAVQADGRILVGGQFTMLGGGGTGAVARWRIGRLNFDGSIDPTFNPGAESIVFALAVQVDGHILAGGTFDGLGAGTGATARNYVGRILNSDPALQSVTVTDGGNTVTWLRNGTMPEVASADFAYSTNGLTYAPLGSAGGAGTRLVGGWRVTGANLPVNANLTIRVRAHYPTGQRGASGSMIEWIVPASDFNTIENGDFTLGLSGWLFFATPDMTYIQHNVTNEVLNFYRNPPPPGTTNQAVAYQQTGVPLAANVPLVAEFDLGNSSSVRKRVSVLLHDSDFSDIAVCTFWLPANSALVRYGIRSHTTKAWANLTIAFYAASAGSNGGAYQIDNVSVRYSPGGSTTETLCEDALVPGPIGGPDGAEMLVNGNFASGAVAPGWGLFGQISGSVQGGVFQFTKVAGVPSGVILQPTGQTVAANELLTATFQLGNTSSERKRVTVILHDNSFGDLSACTFWLAPGQPLSNYVYRTYATQAWSNATLSIYPATVGAAQEMLLDNVTLHRTPSAEITGTECIEPASPLQMPLTGAARRALRDRMNALLTPGPAAAEPATPATSAVPGALAAMVPARPVSVELEETIDLTSVSRAWLQLESWMPSAASHAEIQVSADGVNWESIRVTGDPEHWTPVEIDLSAYAGSTIRVRFAFDGPASGWRMRAIRIRTRLVELHLDAAGKHVAARAHEAVQQRVHNLAALFEASEWMAGRRPVLEPDQPDALVLPRESFERRR